MAAKLAFDTEIEIDKGETEAAFVVDVDGFEGPLDLLLELARRQKVDLAKISVLALVEQYLEFIDAAQKVRLELAADYLVMAAWLAYLKSRLLLPDAPKGEEPLAADLATALANRLKHLEAIRAASQILMERPRLGRDIFARGLPQPVDVVKTSEFQASIYDLLSAYASLRQKQANTRVTFKKREVWSIAEARVALERLTGLARDWTVMDDYLISYCVTPDLRRTVRASCFSASLEMVREGRVEIRQDRAFAPIWLRGAGPRAAAAN